ncbi:MAG: DUF4382 domain-containing protein [Rubricoccaceae bacterium]|nr:DUF4382 domain-containing protein [Rubricoccaceae bacterium]
MRFHLIGLVVGAFLLVAGCDNSGSSDTASLRVLLTDAPGDFVSAVVTIDEVYLQTATGDSDPESGRVVLSEDPTTVDLLTLQNEVIALIDDEIVPEGTYTQLRLVISGGYIEVENESGSTDIYASSEAYATDHGVVSDGRLQMPSYGSSGLKITLPNELGEVVGDQNVILLDFKVSESFGHMAGGSGMWVMHPVVSATDLALTGSIDVALALDEDVTLTDGFTLADFALEVDKEGELISVPFEFSESEGVYAAEVLFLSPNSYAIDLVVPDGLVVSTDAELPLDVSVSSGGRATLTLVITSAEEE